MKQIVLLSITLCLLAGMARAGTVSGTVINAATSATVSGQKVYIQDSLTTYHDSTTTNSTGGYSFTIPSSLPAGYLMVYAPACGYMHTRYTSYSGSNMTVNFAICAGSGALYLFEGTVSLGSTANNGLATVYLIRKQYDPVLLDTTLTAIDSVTTAAAGGAFAKAYSTIPSGTLLVKAALKSTHPSYTSFLPTYYLSSLNWSGATSLSSFNFTGALTNISMIAGVNPGGSGFIGGSVLLGANKSAGVGDPLSSRILLLTTAAGQAVAYTYSDAAGNFSISNLSPGTYNLFGDALGKTNPKLSITLTSASLRVNNVVFEENNKTFKGHIGTLGVGANPGMLSTLRIYPNPATDYVQVEGLNRIDGAKDIVLSNITGAVVSRQHVAAGQEASVRMAELPAGVYLMQVQTTEGNMPFRIMK